MTYHQVVCVDRAASWDGSHVHITRLRLGSLTGYWHRIGVPDAIAQLRLPFGDRYFTVSPRTGAQADVFEGGCEVCGQRPYVRTTADGIRDNNLGALPYCRG